MMAVGKGSVEPVVMLRPGAARWCAETGCGRFYDPKRSKSLICRNGTRVGSRRRPTSSGYHTAQKILALITYKLLTLQRIRNMLTENYSDNNGLPRRSRATGLC